MKNKASQPLPPLKSVTHPTVGYPSVADFVPLCKHPKRSEKNKLATPHTPARKPNQARDKSSIDKTHVIAGGLLLLVWVAIIGAQGVIKAAAGVELWSDPVLIAITVNVRLVFVQFTGSGLPLSRSAGERSRKNKPAARRK